MDKIYMDEGMCCEFDIPYYDEGQRVSLTPAELVSARRRGGKTYDEAHMNLFAGYGMQKHMALLHVGLGWFEVINESR